MTDLDTAETTVQSSTTSVPNITSRDSENPTQTQTRTIALEDILDKESSSTKPETENEIKAHVLQTIAKLKHVLLGEYKGMQAVYYNIHQHTYVFAGMNKEKIPQAIKVWTPAPWFTETERVRKHNSFCEEIDFVYGLHQLMRGENVARVTSIGMKKIKDDPLVYFTTNYIEKALSHVHPAIFPLKSLVNVHKQIAKVLSFIHTNYRILHRDIKPDNILLNNADQAFLIDFGAVEGMHIKNRYAEIGTIPYLSPAQAKGLINLRMEKAALALDYSTDMYSLGTTLANTLFKGHPENKLAALADFHQKTDNPDGFYIRLALGPEITFPSTGNTALDEFIYRSRTQTKDKYASMEEVANALEAIELNLSA